MRTDEPVAGQVTIHTWQKDTVGAGLTTVYVELFAGVIDGVGAAS